MFENQTPEVIRARILDAQSSTINTAEGSFSADQAAPISTEIAKLYEQLDAQRQVFLIELAEDDYLIARAAEYGIYQKPGVVASGMITVTGTVGSTLPAGSIVMTDANLQYATQSAVTLTDTTATVDVHAVEAGAKYNVDAGAIVRYAKPYTGFSAVTNSKISGGADPETMDALRQRLLLRLQTPATSGNAYHYKQWALETPGIGAALVIPLWAGNGTVKVVVVGSDMTAPDLTTVGECAAHIEEVRPIGATVTVNAPSEQSISVTATVTIDSTTTLSSVKTQFADALDDMLAQLITDTYAIAATSSDATYTLLYSRVVYQLLNIPGVRDYSTLTVNGGTANISLPITTIPVLGEVTVNG